MGRPATGKTQLQITLKLDQESVYILNEAKSFGYCNRNRLINICIKYWNLEVLQKFTKIQKELEAT